MSGPLATAGDADRDGLGRAGTTSDTAQMFPHRGRVRSKSAGRVQDQNQKRRQYRGPWGDRIRVIDRIPSGP